MTEIKIKKCTTADSRTCDSSKVTKGELLSSSFSHIDDVREGLRLFRDMLTVAAISHDWDKIEDIDGFYHDFKLNFKETTWWDNHRKIHRHHLTFEDGTPSDVNLVDVLEYITDCVMAGKARGAEKFYPVTISPEVLMLAFNNTSRLLESLVVVE